MAADDFNSLGGYSVGIPPLPVIDANGNVVTNVLVTSGNVAAANIYGGNYFYANGRPFNAGGFPIGPNTSVQYNNDTEFGGSANFTFDNTTELVTIPNLNITGLSNLGPVSNITITGGSSGYSLTTDGNGTLFWTPPGSGTSGISKGSSNLLIPVSNGNIIAGVNGTANVLTITSTGLIVTGNVTAPTFIGNIASAGTVTTNAQPNITSVGTLTSLNVSGTLTAPNIVGNLTGSANTVTDSYQPNITTIGTLIDLNVDGNISAGNVTATEFFGNVACAFTANTVIENAQPNITSVGTLSNLSVAGNSTAQNLLANSLVRGTIVTALDQLNTANLSSNGLATIARINVTNTANLGSISNIVITGGTSGQILSTDGAGNLSWTYDKTTYGNSNVVSLLSDFGSNIITTTGNITAGNLIGNGSRLTSLTGANVTGYVPNATHANIADSANNVSGANVFGDVAGADHANIADVANSVSSANIVGQVANALVSGTVYTNSQPNITSVGTLTRLTVSGTTNLGSVGNITITGGTNGYVLQTNGLGGLSWVGISTSSISNGNSNVNIPSSNGNVNISAYGNANILVVTGTGVNITGNLNVPSGIISGNGNGLSSIVGANVSGAVAYATTAYSVAGANVSGQVANALVAGTVYTNAQPNITSVGTLISLSVTGNINGANIIGNHYGAGNNLSNIQGSNVTGAVAFATTANNVAGANVSGQVNYAAVANSIAGANVSGQVNYAAIANSVAGANVSGQVNYAAVANSVAGANVSGQVANALVSGTVYTNSQPNITSVGTLTSLSVTGNINGDNLIGNHYGAGNNLSNIQGSNVTGAVAFATTANSVAGANVSGQVNYAAIANSVAGANVTGAVAFATTANNVAGINVSGQVNYAAVANSVAGANVSGEVNYANIANNVAGANVSGQVNYANTANNVAGANVSGQVNYAATANSVAGANVSGQVANALVAGTVYTNSQPNITSVGTLTSVTVSGTSNLGSIGNVKVTGGTSGQLISTDGSGNLSFITLSTSTLTNGNSNINVLANSNITFSSTGNANVLVISGSGANVTGCVNVSGNVTASNFIGNVVGNISGNIVIPGSNTGVVFNDEGNANTSTSFTFNKASNTVTITGTANVGNLNSSSTVTSSNLSVTGNANIGNIGTTNLVATGAGSFGANVNMATNWINNVGYPSLSTDAATKQYVDNMVSSGISYHPPVAAATTTTLAIATGGTTAYVQPNGAGNGVGAYISTTGTYLNIDGANVQTVGTRILVKDEANATWNGVYTYANTTAIVRSTDTDEYGPDSVEQLSINDFFFTQGGVVNKDVGFILSAPAGVITFGTSNITFSIFTTAQVYSPGTGIDITGTTISIANTTVLPSSYGNGDRIPSYTVNQQGQLTSASNVVITANAANLSGTTLASGVVNSSLTNVGSLTGLTVSNSSGTVNFITTANVSLGAVANVHISGGSNGYYLQTDGSGNLTWVAISASSISNGNSNVNIPSANGNVNISAVGNANVLVVTGTGANITGTLNTTGLVTISNTAGGATAIAMGSPTQGNLISNAVTLTTSSSVSNAIAQLNAVLGKLVPVSPPNFPASQTLAVQSLSTYRMTNYVQTDNTPGANKSVSGGTTVTTVLRTGTYNTNSITTAGPGDSGIISVQLNGATSGSRTLTTSLDGNGTYSNLTIFNNYDYHSANSSIPAGFWSVFSANAAGTVTQGWNEVYISDSVAANTNTPSWFYDSSNPGTPAFSTLTISPPGSPSYTYSSTVPHYNNTNIFTITANVNKLSGNMYPTSDNFVTGTSGGAFGTPGNVTYAAAGVTTPLAQNLYVSSGNASISTTSTIISGFGASNTGPSLSSNNSYASNTQSFTATLAANVLYKTGTTSSATVLEEANVYVGSTIGSGSGLAYRIVNPGSSDTPVYTGSEVAFNSQSSTLQTYDSTIVANILKHDQTNYSTGYLPAGPNLSIGRTGSQYFTFKIVRTSVSKFDVKWTGNIAGLWVALPGSIIDSTSSANGWIDMSVAYAGAGIPGVNSPGNGSNGCALGGVAPINSAQTNKSVTATFGTVSSSSTATNEIYIRIKLTSGQSVTALSLQTASN